MITPKVPVAHEGVPFIGIFAFLTILSAIFSFNCLTVIFLLATVFTLYFFRDPERFVPQEENAIISPADGKVIVIERVSENPFIEGHAFKVSIFMNVFNVHVNRNPIAGTVKEILYKPGQFYSADSKKGAEYNENCGVVVETANNKKLAYVQVAGLIARRIVCWLEKGDTTTAGKRFGLIRFGSRVDLYLPVESTIEVNLGDKVRAGETILGYIAE